MAKTKMKIGDIEVEARVEREDKFTKSQVLVSKKLPYSKDLINAILDEDKTYTLKEVELEVNKYLKGKVN